MRAGTGRRSARARGKEVRNRKTFRQTTTPQRNQIRKTASTYGGRFLFLAGCTKGRNARARIPTSGNDDGPLPRGRGRRSEEAGDAGLETRRSETRKHAGRRHRSTQNGDTGARRTETQEHAGRKRGDTQDRDAGARRTETREHAGRRRRGHADANGPATGKTAANQESSTLLRPGIQPVAYTTNKKARSQKRPGPVLTYGAATLRRQQAPRLRLPTHTTSNRCTHRQARHMQQAQRRQAPKRLPAPRRARA